MLEAKQYFCKLLLPAFVTEVDHLKIGRIKVDHLKIGRTRSELGIWVCNGIGYFNEDFDSYGLIS